MQSRFATAKTILAFISFLGWLSVIGGSIGFVAGLFSRSGDAAMISGIGSAITGILIILGASIASAQIATADGIADLNRVTRDSLGDAVRLLSEIEAQLSQAPSVQLASAPSAQPKSAGGAVPPGVVQVYRGEAIERRAAGFLAKGRILPTIEEAREYIDKFKQTE